VLFRSGLDRNSGAEEDEGAEPDYENDEEDAELSGEEPGNADKYNEDEAQEKIAEREAVRLRNLLDSVLDAKKVEWEAEKQELFSTVEDLKRENARLKALEDDKKLSQPLFDEAPEKLMQSVFGEDAPDFLRNLKEDYPDMAKAMVAVSSKMMNQFVKSAAERQDALQRAHERQQTALREQGLQTAKQLGSVGIKVEVFGSKEFQNFESSPDGERKHAEFAERFGFGTLEYARHMYDAFSRTIRKSSTVKAKEAPSILP
jgi:hypothetical protein